jgi:hypothetical protein
MINNMTMIKLDVHEVKAHLSEHLERGEEDVVVIRVGSRSTRPSAPPTCGS